MENYLAFVKGSNPYSASELWAGAGGGEDVLGPKPSHICHSPAGPGEQLFPIPLVSQQLQLNKDLLSIYSVASTV